MAWNNDDWEYVGTAANGTGLYQNKYNASLYADGNGKVGTKADLTGGAAKAPSEKYLEFGSQGPGTYQVDENGYEIPGGGFKPKAASGGSGGSSGTSASAWSRITDPATGDVYDYNEVTKEKILIFSGKAAASNSNDKDQNGYDDTTGRIAGSYLIGGELYYQGTRINPDGSPYTGGSGKTTTWTGYGSQGQGTYILDENYNEVKYLGPTTNPNTSSSSSGGGTTSIKLSGGSSGGGGGGGSSSQYDIEGYRAMTTAAIEREAAMQALKAQYREPDTVSAEGSASRAFQAEQNAIDRAIRQQETAAERRARQITEFRSAVNDTDPNAVRAWQYAQGIGAGGNFVNRMNEGGDALSPNALTGAAALLGELRGSGQSTSGIDSWLTPGLENMAVPGLNSTGATVGSGVTSVGTGGIDAGPMPAPSTGTPTTPGTTTATTPARPTLSGNWRLVDSPGGAQWMIPGNEASRRPFAPGETTGPTNWAAMPSQNAQQRGEFSTAGDPNGVIRAGNWVRVDSGGVPLFWINQNTMEKREVDPNDTYGGQLKIADAMANAPKTPEQRYLESMYTKDGGQYYNQGLGADDAQAPLYTPTLQSVKQAQYGMQIYNPGTFNAMGQYVPGLKPAAPKPTYQAQIDTEYKTPLTTQAVLPALSRGGPAQGPYISGDSPDGRPNPELNIPMGNGRSHVIPLRQMPPQQRRMVMGLPRYADGTDVPPSSSWVDPYANTRGTPPPQTIPYAEPQLNPTPVPPLPSGEGQPVPPYVGVKPTVPTSVYTGMPIDTGPSNLGTQPASPTTPPATTVPGLSPSQPGMPAPVTPPVTVDTLSGNVDVTALPLGQQQLIDEIGNWRRNAENVDLGGNSPYSLEFAAMNPYAQQAYLKAQQTRYGIPSDALAWEIARQQTMMPGLSRGQAAVRY